MDVDGTNLADEIVYDLGMKCWKRRTVGRKGDQHACRWY